MKLFKELKIFFSKQVNSGIFLEIPVEIPYYIGRDEDGEMKWYATKWYKCLNCGCLWEFNYPDFPAKGLVRKFSDGVYYPKE